MINIYDYNNTLLLHLCNEDETEAVVSDNIQSIPLNEGSVYSHTLMGEDSISLKFSLDNPIKLTVGSYVKDSSLGAICKNNPLGWFILCDNATPTYNQTTGGYDYDIKFNAWYFFWNRYILKLNPQYGAQESSFTLTSTIDEHFKVLKENINRYFASSGLNRYDGFDVECVVYNNVDNSAKPISYDAVHITDALTTIAQAYDCEWWIESNIVYFGKCDKTIDDPIELEVGKEIASISSSKSSSIYSTRLYAFGSTRNISARYRKPHTIDTTIYSFEKRLMLPIDKCPMNYVDSDTIKDEYGNVIEKKIEESVIVFDDVYPKKEVKIKKIETEDEEITEEETGETRTVTHYRFFVDKDDFWFDEEYLMPEKTLSIIFQTGKLAGMEFELENFNKDVEGTNYQSYEIIINSNYSVDLPNSTLYPSVDDVIIFFNYDASLLDDESNTLVRSAEEELYQKTLDYLKVSEIDDNTYDVTLSADYAYGVINNGDLDKSNAKILSLGDSVTLKDESKFDEKGRTSRVIGIEVKLDVPYDSPTYSIGESKAYSRIGELEGKIEGVKTSSSSSIGGGGGMSANTVESIIKNNGGKYFISKLKDDTAEGYITFNKGLTSKGKGTFEKDLDVGGSLDVEGAARVGGALRVEGTAHTHDIDNDNKVTTKDLEVTGSAHFYEVVIDRAKNTAAIEFKSPANAKIDIVEQKGDVYRCYFLAKDADNRQVVQGFRAKDQILMQTCNLRVGSQQDARNRFFWALCTNVSEEPIAIDNREYHWIDIDMSVKASNSNAVPQAEDDIVVLGHRGSYADRGNAILFASIDSAFLNLRRPDADKDGNHPLLKAPMDVQLQGINSFDISYSNPNNYGNILSNGYNRIAGYLYSSSSSQDDAVVKIEVSHVDYYLCTATLEAPEASASGWAAIASPSEQLPYIWKKTIKTYNDGTSQPFVEFVNRFVKGVDGKDGRDGQGITFNGERWSQELVDSKGGKLPKLYAVRMADKIFIVTNPDGTANPPIFCITDWQGRRLRTSEGGYVLRRGEDGNYIVNKAEWEAMAQFGVDGKDGRDGVNGKDGEQGIGVKYVSVYKRGNVSQMDKPNDASVSFDNPIPSGWSKGIPAGEEICWQSTRAFWTDGRADEWSKPEPITDTADFDRCFSKDDKQPPKPTSHGTQSDTHWHNDPQEGDKWMATAVCKNGAWGEWQITQILGENATNVNVRGEWREGMTLSFMDVVRFEGISYLYKSKETWSGYPRAKILDYQGRIVRNWTGGLIWANNGQKALFATDDRWQVFAEDAVSLVVAKGFEVAKIKGKATDGVFTFASEQEALVELRRGTSAVDDDMAYSIELNGCKGVSMQRVGSVCRINIPATATVDATKVEGYDYYLPVSDCSITVNCSFGGRIYSVVLPIQIDYSDRWSEFVQTDEQFKSELNAVKQQGKDLQQAQSTFEQKILGKGGEIEGVKNELSNKYSKTEGDLNREAVNRLIQDIYDENGNIKMEQALEQKYSFVNGDTKGEAIQKLYQAVFDENDRIRFEQELAQIVNGTKYNSLSQFVKLIGTDTVEEARTSINSEIEGKYAKIETSVKRVGEKIVSDIVLDSDHVSINCKNFSVSKSGDVNMSGKVSASQYRAQIKKGNQDLEVFVDTTAIDFTRNANVYVLPELTSQDEYLEITGINYSRMQTPIIRCVNKDRFVVQSSILSSPWDEYLLDDTASKIQLTGLGIYKFYGYRTPDGGRWFVIKTSFMPNNKVSILSTDDQDGLPPYITKLDEIGNIDSSENRFALFSYITTNGTPKCDDDIVNLEIYKYGAWIVIPANTTSAVRTHTFRIYIEEDKTKYVEFTFTQSGVSDRNADDVPTQSNNFGFVNSHNVIGINTDALSSGTYVLKYLDSDGNARSNYEPIDTFTI